MPTRAEHAALLSVAAIFAAILCMRTETDGRPLAVLILVGLLAGAGLAVRDAWRKRD